MNLQVRRAENKDTAKITDLLNQVLMVHHNGRPDLFKGNCRKYTDEQLEILIADDDRPIFVAVNEDGDVLGYSFCIVTQQLHNNILTDIKTLYIDDLCVDENSRGQHVGKTIYEYVKGYAREIGCYNLTLNVWACNERAMEFYNRQGLQVQKMGMETIL
ncbi:MAG: GNAT family N-acetyltransferase [Lachnospiraceae bacterium]|nr:GNAT family N-acetyltransferase [Lachnospiraceae bacterium]